MSALSRMARYSPRVNIGKEELLIALRAYLDSSGKLENAWITLAAIAGPEGMWQEFEVAWQRVLDSYPLKATYVHMREVYRLEKEFDSTKGWDHNKAFGLVNQELVYVSNLPKAPLRMFYCSVDLQAWQRLRAKTYQMPDPIELCNKFCTEQVLGWYFLNYPQLINPHTDTVKYFFDRNEYFYQPFYDKWNREKNLAEETGSWSPWNVIESVVPAEMKKTPGIQMADIIAWARNRETFTKEGDLAHWLGHILRTVIPSYYIIWDEEKLKQQFKPLLYLP